MYAIRSYYELKIDYSLYQDMNTVSSPDFVFLRGKLIAEKGEVKGNAGEGRFIAGKTGTI